MDLVRTGILDPWTLSAFSECGRVLPCRPVTIYRVGISERSAILTDGVVESAGCLADKILPVARFYSSVPRTPTILAPGDILFFMTTPEGGLLPYLDMIRAAISEALRAYGIKSYKGLLSLVADIEGTPKAITGLWAEEHTPLPVIGVQILFDLDRDLYDKSFQVKGLCDFSRGGNFSGSLAAIPELSSISPEDLFTRIMQNMSSAIREEITERDLLDSERQTMKALGEKLTDPQWIDFCRHPEIARV